MLTFFKNPLALAGLAALITWWLLRRKADCHCDGPAGNATSTPPATSTNIWGGYTTDPYNHNASSGPPGCAYGLVRDVNTGNCMTPIG